MQVDTSPPAETMVIRGISFLDCRKTCREDELSLYVFKVNDYGFASGLTNF